MKKLIFLYLFASLLSSCVNDDKLFTAYIDDFTSDNQHKSEYNVSIEDALEHLDLAYKTAMSDNITTRSECISRRVKSIQTLKAQDVLSQTRSNVIPDLEDLFYIVDFEDSGSAILGADSRIESVYAILDETVLTAADFSNTPATDSTDIKSFMVNLIKDAALRNLLSEKKDTEWVEYQDSVLVFEKDIQPAIKRQSTDLITPITPQPNRTKLVTYQYDVRNQKPLLKTKWGQGAPYNNSCPLQTYSTTYHQPAGCVPIAVAQILFYNRTDRYITIEDKTFDYNLIRVFSRELLKLEDSEPSEEAEHEIADFIYALGSYMHTNYGDAASGTSDYMAKTLFTYIGYQNAIFTNFNYEYAQTMICDMHLPFYTHGERETAAHAWVTDGWSSYVTRSYILEYDNAGRLISSDFVGATDRRNVHVNFGWTGSCDGYYPFDLYDLSAIQTSDICTDAGDIPSVVSRIYDRMFYYIKYNL